MRKSKDNTVGKSNRPLKSVKPTLLALAITQALAFQASQAATIEITSNLDDGTDCTLREALATVNAGVDQLNGCNINTGVDALGANDTITFGPSVAGQTITLTQGELSITKDVGVNLGGVNTTIDANQASRVMSVISNEASDLSVALNQLTITGGNIYSSRLNGGGGISVNNAYTQQDEYNTVLLTLTNSTVTGNTVKANGSELSSGGGIFVSTGFLQTAIVALKNSTVSGNTADSGGGVFLNGDSLTGDPRINLMNSTVSGNTATSYGGGGINTYLGGDVNLTNSTVSGNTGDGIFLLYGTTYIENSTVTDNTGIGILNQEGYAGDTFLRNSIIANNRQGDCAVGGYAAPNDIAGSDTISTTSCDGATVADPVLGPLTDNGGPTQTHALLAGSPAIDNGTGAGATATDQRGVAAEGVRDSGAYEFIAAANALAIEKLINHQIRQTPAQAAQLLAGTRYRSDYKVTNNSPDRVYSVRVFEDGQLVCTLYDLMPGQSKQKDRCANFNNVLAGLNNVPANVTAKVSGSNQTFASQTNAYYNGFGNVPGKLKVTHYINEKTADTQGNAVSVNSNQAEVKFKVENTGSITLYRVKLYHDPASPLNSGWQELCYKGTLAPGEVRYCKRTIDVTASGLNKAFGRAQGRDSNVGSGGVVNASNPTYFIVP